MGKNAETPWRKRVEGVAPHALTVGAVVLGWQIVIQPLIQRGPVEAAIRVAPGSPLVIRRAAEAELTAGRTDNAAALGRNALRRSPFDVRALRVVGLTEARAGRTAQADQLLTLAGNWSLRDDPAHAWLVGNRLRRGDYASAFAHADTLARRRADIRPQVFHLFTTAATQDPSRALPVLAGLLAAEPPWRSVYLSNLNGSVEGLRVAVNLALLLQRGRTALNDAELQRLYIALVGQSQIGALKTLRNRLNRPPLAPAVTNGSFGGPAVPVPFQWELIQKAGAIAVIMPSDVAQRNASLRVEYDGYTTALIARQVTVLDPGRYRLRAESRIESGKPGGRMIWTVTCGNGETRLSASAVPSSAEAAKWAASVMEFSVPANCPSQWLELRGAPLDYRARMVVWFDRVSISALNGRSAGVGVLSR